jgi:DNA-binding transcriptional LysR family regulator
MTRDELIEKMARKIDPAAWMWVATSAGDTPIAAAARQRSLSSASAALSAIESVGLAIVPKEIAPAQIAKGHAAFRSREDCFQHTDEEMAAIYRAMIEDGRVK